MAKELDLYTVTLDELGAWGIDKISFVDFPAVESNYLLFNKDAKKMQFSVENEEQRIVSGVLLRADYPIYRIGNSGYEYNLVFSKEIIKELTLRMLESGAAEKFNLMHSLPVNGVRALEFYLKDSSRGISPKGFEDISEGSLFGSFKIENDELWEAIKEGEFKGFSVEGVFGQEYVEEAFSKQTEEDEVLSMLSDIENKLMELK